MTRKSRLWKVASLAVIVALSGCASGGRQPPSEGLTDDWISAEVRRLLSQEDDLAGAAIRVETRDRVVVLTGIVETLDQAREALRLAGRVEGVEQVVNRLRVIPGGDGEGGPSGIRGVAGPSSPSGRRRVRREAA